MEPWHERTRENKALLLLLIFLAYLAGADAGHALGAAIAPTLIWPPAGIALAAVLLTGEWALGAIGLAAFVFEFFINHYALLPALALALANVVQVLLAARTLRQLSFNAQFARLSDAFMLIAVSIGAAAVVPTLGSITLYLDGHLAYAQLSSIWGSWYVGELLSLLVLTPFLVRWLPKFSFKRTREEWFEIAAAIVATATISILIFCTPYGVIDGVPLIYVLLMPLIWIGLRMGPRIMTLALFLMSTIGIAGTIVRASPGTIVTTLFSIELLFSILTILFMFLVALAEERKRATHALRRQLLRLEDALEKIRDEDQAKSDFLAVLAHELRNPLAPLLSSLELLRLTETSPKALESVNAMRGRVRTMARLLDDLLDVTRITHGKLVLRKEPIDLAAVVRRAIETTEPELALHRHTFKADLPKKPLFMLADPVRIEQVVVNLLNNAAKYTEDGGEIRLTLEGQGKEGILTVKDTGVGIVPSMLEQIFEPFRQGAPAKRMSRGLGIGLALSKNLVELHDGTIEARSGGPGTGSVFVVRLPLTKAPTGAGVHANERSRQIKQIRTAKTPLTVLIVDDNKPAADALMALLKHIGHKAYAAYDGASGIERAGSLKPHAIILDIGLPDMEGYEVARRLKMAGTKATLIALTGYGQKEDKQEALDAGFAYHLTKPVGLVDVEAILRTVSPK
jgi:signal transduction histidine kinase